MTKAGTRFKLPVKRCQYGVPAATEESVQPCGRPAVAVWFWGKGKGLLVCDEHDGDVAASEEETDDAIATQKA